MEMSEAVAFRQIRTTQSDSSYSIFNEYMKIEHQKVLKIKLAHMIPQPQNKPKTNGMAKLTSSLYRVL